MAVTQKAAIPLAKVREIPEGESLRQFIDVAWTINAEDPHWIAPLRMAVNTALDRKKHPFHHHAEVAYFLAERDGKAVGRIAAIVNHLHNEFHEDKVGFFGLFECENNTETAALLFDAAAGWLRQRGRDVMRGPMNLSTNEEVASPGLLVEGFHTPPYLMMAHNLVYYVRLFETAGMAKAKDLLAFYFADPTDTPSRGTAMVDRLLERAGATVRQVNMKRFRQEVDKMKEVYNSAWSQNWGFVPMTDAEFEFVAKEYKPVVDPVLAMIAEAGDEPIGFSLAMPNYNEVFRHIPDGRLFPFGVFKFLWYKRKIRSMRFMTLGFKPRFHHAGLGVAFYARTFLAGVKKGYIRGEASWILEDNHEMVRQMERMGAVIYRRYRVYDRML